MSFFLEPYMSQIIEPISPVVKYAEEMLSIFTLFLKANMKVGAGLRVFAMLRVQARRAMKSKFQTKKCIDLKLTDS